MRRLRDTLATDLKKSVGGGYIENEGQLPFVGLYIIMVACGTERVAEELRISDPGSMMLLKAMRYSTRSLRSRRDVGMFTQEEAPSRLLSPQIPAL
jgi:hypothetical protein